MKINYPLLALAIGAFGIGTTEFSPMGLLPVIARGVDVSIPAAGTPPIFARVNPINIVATALACLCFGTTLAATTEPKPKNAP